MTDYEGDCIKLRARNNRLGQKVWNYHNAMKEIYGICLDRGKSFNKVERIKEICRKYKIPKK